jgi:hypothetical protein
MVYRLPSTIPRRALTRYRKYLHSAAEVENVQAVIRANGHAGRHREELLA